MTEKSHSSFAAAPVENRRCGNFLSLLAWISVAAFFLRLIACWQMSRAGGGFNNVMTPPAASDLCTYMNLAKEIARGAFPQEFYYQPYYYTLFLPPFYLLFSSFAIPAVIAAQALLGGAAVFLTGLCAARIFSQRAGLIAATFTALSVPLILYTPFHQNETLQSFHLILLLYLTLRMAETPSRKWWSLGGLAASVAILTRGNVWLLLPAVCGIPLISLIRRKYPWKRVAAVMLCFWLLLLLPMIPFCWKNSSARGSLCGPSTAADAVLALGNSPEAPAGGREPGSPAGPMEYPEAFHRMMKLSSQGISVPRQMFRWFRTEPLAFCELQWRKFLLFWDGREIPNNVSLEYDGFASPLLRWNFIGRTACLLPFALAGIFFFLPRLFRKPPIALVILYAFAALFLCAVAAFYLLSRFRAPILPILFLFAGGFLHEAAERCRKEKTKPFFCFLCFFLLFFFSAYFVWGAYDAYRAVEPAVMRFVRPGGTSLRNPGLPSVFFDHGPETFGGWIALPAHPGVCFEKQFSGCRDQEGEISLLLVCERAASLRISLNGESRTILLPAPRNGTGIRHRITLPVTLHDGKCRISIEAASAPCFFVMDTQRDYGRSRCRNRPLAGELVWRFQFSPKVAFGGV